MAHRLLHLSTLGSRFITKYKRIGEGRDDKAEGGAQVLVRKHEVSRHLMAANRSWPENGHDCLIVF